jgi:hypothetical protein
MEKKWMEHWHPGDITTKETLQLLWIEFGLFDDVSTEAFI